MHFVKHPGKSVFSFFAVAVVSISIILAGFGTKSSAADAETGGKTPESSFITEHFGFITNFFGENENTQESTHSQTIDSAKNVIAGSQVFDEFNEWINSYLNNELKAGSEQMNAGANLALRRRQLLEELARLDPQAALEKSMPAAIFNRLPSSITGNSEKRVSANGDFLVYEVEEMNRVSGERNGSHIEREVVIGKTRYKALVYGRRETMTTKLNIPLQGVVIGDTILVDEKPARKIDSSEYNDYKVDASVPGSDGIAAEIGGKAVSFSDQADYENFVREQIEWESKIGPERPKQNPAPEATASTWTEGTKTVLVLRVDFSDAPGEPLDHYNQPLTASRALSLISSEVSTFYINSSYNKTSMVGTVTPVLRLPRTQAYYSQGSNFNIMLDDARAAALSVGYNTDNFNLDLLCFSYTPNIGWVGIAAVGYKGALLNGAFYMPEAAHELGHNYGLVHANLWRTTDGSVIGPGYNVEYGDCYDNMGACINGNETRQFNAKYKRILDWLTDANVQTVTTTGVYRIYAQDSPSPGGIRTLKIPKDATKNYWVEFRQLIPGSAQNGALVRWDYASQNFQQTQVLDMVPATTTTGDEPLLIGQSFYDSASQIKITVLGKGGTTPESLDVKVEVGGSTPTPTPTPTCAYSITPANQNFGAAGGIGSVSVTSPTGCGWTANALQNFVNVTAGGSGAGSGTVTYLVGANLGQARTATITIAGLTFSVNQSAGIFASAHTAFDFDGDGKADVSVFRPSVGIWYLQNSSSGFTGVQFGLSTDVPAAADYDGDGRTDIAVYRNGTWYINRSTDGFTTAQFGDVNDVPQPADYDGDGKAELAVFRPSNGVWYFDNLATNQISTAQFGAATDKPVAADYDGDGKADIAVFRPSNGFWYVNRSQSGFTGVQFGLSTDVPAAADYDGDGKADIAVYRGGTWYIQQSLNGFTGMSFGAAADKPVPNSFIP